MFNFLKKNKTEVVPDSNISVEAIAEPIEKKNLFSRLSKGLSKTRQKFTDQLASLILGKKSIDAELLEDLESLLISADIGITATQQIINDLTQRINRQQLKDPQMLWQALEEELLQIILPCEQSLDVTTDRPFVILMIGINGAGKTTTIGKLAQHFKHQGLSVMLAAGDTFRAAAVEQLQAWGERNQIPVISQASGSDSASVLYDAVKAAQARNIDILLADTAGRLHNKDHLLEELKKIKRVLSKADPKTPQETILVLDAGIGQNAINQALEFHKALGITSLIITKLDGTAKGGVVFSIAKQLALPIRYIGVGEKLEDLRPFKAKEFIDALLGKASKDEQE